MADPATDTTYPLALDELPAIGPLDKQNAPGLEHDEMHNRANAILNALQSLVGLSGDGPAQESIVGQVAALVAGVTEPVIKTGASYTLAVEDAGKMICMDRASANELVVPPDSEVAFPVGARIDLCQDGLGTTTVVPGAGVIIRTPETLVLRKRYAKASLFKRAPDTWDLEGNLEASP